jgi:hypothetical protein
MRTASLLSLFLSFIVITTSSSFAVAPVANAYEYQVAEELSVSKTKEDKKKSRKEEREQRKLEKIKVKVFEVVAEKQGDIKDPEGWKSWIGKQAFKKAAAIIRWTPNKWIRWMGKKIGFSEREIDGVIRNKIKIANKLDEMAEHMDHVGKVQVGHLVDAFVQIGLPRDVAFCAANIIHAFLY